MRRLNIGIDIDNVVADSYPAYLEKFNTAFNESIKYEEITDFYYLDTHKSSVSGFVDSLVVDEEFQLSIPPYEKVKEVIKKWSKIGHSLHYITARPIQAKKATSKWLDMHGLMVKGATLDLFDDRYHTRDIEFKKRVADKIGIDILIEDSKEIAEGMEIPVLLIDRPWNQGELPKNVVRVKSWQEIEHFVANLI